MFGFGAFSFNRQGFASPLDLHKSAAIVASGRVLEGSRNVVLLCTGAGGRHSLHGSSGGGLGRHLGPHCVTPLPLKGADICKLVPRRPKRLPSFRLVPLGHSGARVLIIGSIDRPRVKPKPIERLLQLVNIIAGATGDEVPVCRDLALENENGAPRCRKYYIAFLKLSVSRG